MINTSSPQLATMSSYELGATCVHVLWFVGLSRVDVGLHLHRLNTPTLERSRERAGQGMRNIYMPAHKSTYTL